MGSGLNMLSLRFLRDFLVKSVEQPVLDKEPGTQWQGLDYSDSLKVISV